MHTHVFMHAHVQIRLAPMSPGLFPFPIALGFKNSLGCGGLGRRLCFSNNRETTSSCPLPFHRVLESVPPSLQGRLPAVTCPNKLSLGVAGGAMAQGISCQSASHTPSRVFCFVCRP